MQRKAQTFFVEIDDEEVSLYLKRMGKSIAMIYLGKGQGRSLGGRRPTIRRRSAPLAPRVLIAPWPSSPSSSTDMRIFCNAPPLPRDLRAGETTWRRCLNWILLITRQFKKVMMKIWRILIFAIMYIFFFLVRIRNFGIHNHIWWVTSYVQD